MIDQLKDKRVIFFDVGYTLDRPASGDWMFTNRFLQEAGEGLKRCSREEIGKARDPTDDPGASCRLGRADCHTSMPISLPSTQPVTGELILYQLLPSCSLYNTVPVKFTTVL